MDPPHNHRANLAERAIQTFKAHFKTGLALVHPEFPIQEWEQLLNQAELTLNLLRAARVNPALSAWAYLIGQFDFAKTSLAPPGTELVSHDKPNHQPTWALNEEEGWYVGQALQHYQ